MQKQILIVSADTETARSIQEVAESAGHAVDVARTSHAGLNVVSKKRPDLIVLVAHGNAADAEGFLKLLPFNSSSAIPILLAGDQAVSLAAMSDEDTIDSLEGLDDQAGLKRAMAMALGEKTDSIDSRLQPTTTSLPFRDQMQIAYTRAKGSDVRSKKILVVDDDESLGHLLQKTLEYRGYEVSYVQSAQEAVASVKQLPPDLIILDIMMPITDGYQVCRLIKFDQKFRSIPILVLTGRQGKVDKNIAFQVGADAFMTKPYAKEELFETIEELLGKHPDAMEAASPASPTSTKS